MIIDQLFTRPVFESQMDPITQFASNAHEQWRRNFDPTGTKPRIKKNSDGTEGDINVPFADLHPDWQKENLAAGRAAQHAVKHFGNNMEKAAEFIHRQWMKRNPKADYNAAQHVPYDDLSDDEKEKDRVHVRTMMRLMGHQLNEFAPSDDGEGPDQEEILRRLAAHWWNGNEHAMARAEHTLAAMGWEIGEDDGYDDGGVFVVRPGDEHGRSYISWPHEDLELNEVAPPGAKAERMVRHIKQGYARDGKLTPKEKGIAFATAWKAHNAGKVEEQGAAEGLTEMDKSQTPPGRDTGPREGPEKIAKPITKEKMVKHALDALSKSMAKKDDKKKDVKESDPLMLKLRRALIKEGRVKELADDLKTLTDAEFMKKYGKAKAAIRKDMKRVDEARTDYTPEEMADMLSGKRSQKQIDADAERTRGPNKTAPTKESTQSRAKRLNEKMSTSDTLAAGTGTSRLGKKDFDFRNGFTPGDDETDYETENEPELGTFRMGKPVEPDSAATNAFMSAVDSYGEQNPYMQSWGGKFADQDTRIAPLRPGEFNVGGTTWRRVEDPAASAKKEVQWIPSSEADSIASWKANNPGKSAADWGSIPAAGKSAAVGGSPNMRWNSQIRAQEKFDPRTGNWVPVPADGSGANPNIDAATRDRARAWAAQQNAPGAAAKQKVDWKTIYALNKATIGSNPDIIKPRMQLNMPNGTIYLVQPGDTLTKIAAKQNQVNELSTNRLAQYKTAAAKDARQADQEGDFKRGDKRFHGIVQATKKQFDNDAKKVDESRAARRALMAQIVNHR